MLIIIRMLKLIVPQYQNSGSLREMRIKLDDEIKWQILDIHGLAGTVAITFYRMTADVLQEMSG